jgi:hypothetical protein
MGVWRARNPGDGIGIERERHMLVLLEERQVRVGTLELFGERGPNAFRLGPRVSAFPRTKAHQRKLIVFAALELQCPAVGAVGDKAVPHVPECERLPEAGGIHRGQVDDELMK